jgi:hypothetical protein
MSKVYRQVFGAEPPDPEEHVVFRQSLSEDHGLEEPLHSPQQAYITSQSTGMNPRAAVFIPPYSFAIMAAQLDGHSPWPSPTPIPIQFQACVLTTPNNEDMETMIARDPTRDLESHTPRSYPDKYPARSPFSQTCSDNAQNLSGQQHNKLPSQSYSQGPRPNWSPSSELSTMQPQTPILIS